MCGLLCRGNNETADFTRRVSVYETLVLDWWFAVLNGRPCLKKKKKKSSNQVESSQITGQFFRPNQCLMKAAITDEGHGCVKCRGGYTMCAHYQLKTTVNVWCTELGVQEKKQIWEQCLQTWLQRWYLWSSVILNTKHCFKDRSGLSWASATPLLATLFRQNIHETQTKQIHIY